MEPFRKDLFGIIQAAFTGKAVDIPSDFDWEKAVGIARYHNIASILYYGAVTCGKSKEEEHIFELYQLTLRGAMKGMRQTEEIEQIEKAFEAANIDYMPLKGTILKKIYPKPEMRAMSDADILIKTEQYPQIEAIMAQLGFSFSNESDHELIWKKPGLFLELHKTIVPTYFTDIYRYFGDGWNTARSVPGSSRHELSPEDFYIFLFVHFTKHYRIAGIGIKHLIDLWVYANGSPELDWPYIEKELEKMHLGKFHAHVRKTIDVWFSGEAETAASDIITDVIFESGQHGTKEMAVVNIPLQKGNDTPLKYRIHRIVSGIFAPYSSMKLRYPILKKIPILLPVMWIVLWFDFLFKEKKRVSNFFSSIGQVDSEKIAKNKYSLEAVGLELNNMK